MQLVSSPVQDHVRQLLNNNGRKGFIDEARPTTNAPNWCRESLMGLNKETLQAVFSILVKESFIFYLEYEVLAQQLTKSTEKAIKFNKALNLIARLLGYKDHKALRDYAIRKGYVDRNGQVLQHAAVYNLRDQDTISLQVLQ